MVNIKINNVDYNIPENITVLEACQRAGIAIPTLCYLKDISEEASCSLCVVEIEGKKTLIRSCVTKVEKGMNITTDNPRIEEARKINLELILGNHPLDCMTCEKDGDCELQDLAYQYGIKKSRFLTSDKIFSKIEKTPWYTNPFIHHDPSKCILCGRCVNACNRHVVIEAICFAQRGHFAKISTPFSEPLEDSNCQLCGACIQACPVGSLVEKTSIGTGKLKDLAQTNTICPYCGVGCKFTVYVNKKINKIVKITGVDGSLTNNGRLCVKGKFGFDFVNSEKRLTHPLIKENGEFKKATWDEALDIISKKFKEIKDKYGPGAIAGLSSAKTTNEENFIFQKFIRAVIGTNNVDHCARLCHSSTVAGLATSLGSGAMTNDYKDLKKADVILITGSDTTETHPVIGSMIKQAVRFGKTKLIVIDPKKIRIADFATIYAQQRCGTDVAVFNGIMHVIIKNGWEDKEYIKERCENFEELKAEVEKYTPEYVEKISGVPAKKIEEIAELFAKADTAAIFYSMGITQHTTGVDNVWSTANLQMLCGNLGKPGGGVNPLRGQANVQGACDLGALPNVYPGYQKVTIPEIKDKFEKAWGVKLSDKIGLTVTEIVNAAGKGDVKALYIMGENPVLSDPNIDHVTEAIKKPFLVVQDIFLTETAQYADVVLPASSFAEKEGHFTNTERRVQRLNKLFDAPGEAKIDWEITQLFANKMGAKWNYKSAKDILNEINQLTPIYGGITWDRIGIDGLQWPCPTKDHPGTPYLHKGKFSRGMGLMKGISFKEPAELPDKEYPFIMTTGRLLYHFHTGTMTRKTDGLNKISGPQVMISVADAEELKVKNGEVIRVKTRRGEIKAPAFVTKRIGKGTIYIPFHFHEAPANRLTNPAVDPVAKIPEYKACAAAVYKA